MATLATRLLSAALLLSLAGLATGCGAADPPHPAGSIAPEPIPQESLPVVSQDELADAVDFRERFGLRADLTYVRAVAGNPDAQAGVPEFGVPLLPGELDDLLSRRWDPDVHRQLSFYGQRFPDDFAGAYINQKASGVIIAFKQNVDQHRAALSSLFPPEALIEVRQVEWSLADLDGFVDRIEAESDWFDSIGVIAQPGRNSIDNVVDLRFRAREDVGDQISAHFGDPAWLRTAWKGPLPWEGARADLTIEVVDTDGQPVPQLWCEVTPLDPTVPSEGESIFGTNGAGICTLKNLPVTSYLVELHEFVDNDHYDPEPIGSVRVELGVGGASAKVVLR